MSYDPSPTYPLVSGHVEVGYDALAAHVVRTRPSVLALDGRRTVPWEPVIGAFGRALAAAGVSSEAVRAPLPEAELERHIAAARLQGDPVFARLLGTSLADLFTEPPGPIVSANAELTLVYGPGSALVPHDELWLLDHPKRVALAAAPNDEQRLFFADWPLYDRHARSLASGLDKYVDLEEPGRPRSVAGAALRATLSDVAGRPFRTRPAFLPGPWGGQWLRGELGIATEADNLAWSYELIAPEAGLLLGSDETVEVGFELLLGLEVETILGTTVADQFEGSFPIRFDYLDTLGGGHLSIQCHPTPAYASEVFGLPYTQHETYYVVETSPGATIYLGLREDADVADLRTEAEHAAGDGIAFEPETYVQVHPAEQHQLYSVPAGTVHASGAGSAVLEISATPYLYTLRFYDWLRRGLDGQLRAVHLEHAFANLDQARRGAAVAAELIREPVEVRAGDGWTELDLRTPDELFYAVHRLDFDDDVRDDTAGHCHVLCLVAGSEVELDTERGAHPLSYGETIVVPASVGPYRLRRVRGEPCKAIKAFVR